MSTIALVLARFSRAGHWPGSWASFDGWPGLVRFLADPKIPLDTNSVERALRGVAVGRKNHYGSRSERGTHVAALFYSLIESAKLCGVEPRAYLREATLRAVRNPGTATLARDLKSPRS